jgi:branched-chain amino acid aminotransferase
MVWIDGRLARGEDARISLFDRGARDGEGLFETLRTYGGRPFLWERHIERLVLSAAELGFPVPPAPATLRAAVEELLAAQDLADAVVRLTVTRGVPGGRPTRAGCWIEAEPLAARLWRGVRSGQATGVTSKTPFEPGPLGRHKTTSRLAYHLAREEARAARADEAILISPRGRALEGAASNLFAVLDGQAVTPPPWTGILPGITRRWALAALDELGVESVERELPRDELDRASEIFLTNAVQEVVPLAALDGRALPPSRIGLGLRERYRGAVLAALG